MDAGNPFMYKCWNCQNDGQNLVRCEHCHSIQPLMPVNAFETLGMSPEYDINLDTLSNHYLERQRLVHPDRFISKPSEEKLYAQQHSSYLNQCYQTLKDNISRAEALLDYHKTPFDSAENTIQDPVLLHESMDHREKLMMMDTKEQLYNFKQDIENIIKAVVLEMKNNLDALKDFHKAKKLILRLKYLEKLLTEIKQKEAADS